MMKNISMMKRIFRRKRKHIRHFLLPFFCFSFHFLFSHNLANFSLVDIIVISKSIGLEVVVFLGLSATKIYDRLVGSGNNIHG